MEKINFRPATQQDAAFIARQVLEALHWEMYVEPLSPDKQAAWTALTPICAQEGVLYSYKHCTIAEVDGQCLGLMVAYDGAGYRNLRLRTFVQIDCLGDTDEATMEDETESGEWYVDSVAVVPEGRGKGVGRQLIEWAVKQACELGLCATLLVDPKNEKAHRLYRAMGFEKIGEKVAFGQSFWRMQHP